MKKGCTFKPQFLTMKKIILLLLVTVGVFAFNQKAEASHAAGGEILYELVPNTTNTYKIIFKFYRDCSGIPVATTQTLCYNNSCSQPTTSIPMPMVSGPTVVSSGCPNFPNSCNNGSNPGYEEYIYETQLTLFQQCNNWKFWVTIGARNNMTFLNGGNLFIEATFDNTVSQNDNSPYFSVKPVPYTCINTPFTFNNGAVDINGDSLVFESIQPRTGPCASYTPTPVTYRTANFPPGQQTPAPNPLNNPIPTNYSFVLNSQTGAMSFTPSTQGTGVITIQCKSFRNGQLIGTVMRDIQVVVLNCSPGTVPPSPVDSNTLVNANLDSLGQVKACSGDSLAFCITLGSTDTDAVLVPYSNINAAMPGGVISYTGALTDSITACVGWQTSLQSAGLHVLVITLIDSSCKPPGILYPYTFSIPVFIDSSIKAFGDTIICAGEQAPLLAIGGGTKYWSVLPGGSPVSSLSCNPCNNPIATPTLPTYYVVEGCDRDTVFVDIAAVPTLVSTRDTTTCVNGSVQLSVSASPVGQTYDYSWSPSNFLSNATISNPVVQNPTTCQTYVVTVTPYGATGPLAACAVQDTVVVDVLTGFSLNAYDTILCDGENTAITGVDAPSSCFGRQYSYTWTPTVGVNPSNTLNTTITPTVPGGSYSVIASYPGCPDSMITISVIMDPVPVVDAGQDREMCLGDTIHLNSTVFPDTIPYTVTWLPGADMDNNTARNPVYRGKTTQTLNVKYVTPNGCEDDDDVLITVNNVDFLQLNGDRAICPGDTTGLSVLGGVSYVWSPNYFISDTGNVTSVLVYPPVSQQYQVIGRDIKGCYDTATANVVVYPGSVVDAGEDVTIYPGESVMLYADGNCSLFDWFPPSGLSDTKVKNPVAQPTATTRYYVNAQTENGCPTLDSVTVIVSNESLIDLPNAFSPGSGTSVNDLLQIRRRGEVTLKRWDIYNRWGEKVFTTNDIDAGWDGRFNNKPQPLGTYVYVIEAETSTGKRFYKQGNVTLVR